MSGQYMDSRPCDECGQKRSCLYEPTGPFRGVWRCYDCQQKDTEALADIVKAATRKLAETSGEQDQPKAMLYPKLRGEIVRLQAERDALAARVASLSAALGQARADAIREAVDLARARAKVEREEKHCEVAADMLDEFSDVLEASQPASGAGADGA